MCNYILLLMLASALFVWLELLFFFFQAEDGIRDLTVTGVQTCALPISLLPGLREIEARWHAAGDTAYRIDVAGAVEESSKGSDAIVAGVPVMLFLTFTLLMLQLRSVSRSLLVFITGPLGIPGVAAALLLLGRPFGFVALLGVVALMGMIQRNSVILIDQIETDRARGVPAWDAIIEAAVRDRKSTRLNSSHSQISYAVFCLK